MVPFDVLLTGDQQNQPASFFLFPREELQLKNNSPHPTPPHLLPDSPTPRVRLGSLARTALHRAPGLALRLGADASGTRCSVGVLGLGEGPRGRKEPQVERALRSEKGSCWKVCKGKPEMKPRVFLGGTSMNLWKATRNTGIRSLTAGQC